MPVVAESFEIWLIGILTNESPKWVAILMCNEELKLALTRAARVAVQRAAQDLSPAYVGLADPGAAGLKPAEQVITLINHAFGLPVPCPPLAGNATILEAIGAGISVQLAAAENSAPIAVSQASGEAYGVRAAVLAETLTSHLLQEIVIGGSRLRLLSALASQLADDAANLQSKHGHSTLPYLGLRS